MNKFSTPQTFTEVLWSRHAFIGARSAPSANAQAHLWVTACAAAGIRVVRQRTAGLKMKPDHSPNVSLAFPATDEFPLSSCPALRYPNSNGPSCFFELRRHWCSSPNLLIDHAHGETRRRALHSWSPYERWACYHCDECVRNAWIHGYITYSPPWPPLAPPPPAPPSLPPAPPTLPLSTSRSAGKEEELPAGAVAGLIIGVLLLLAVSYWCGLCSCESGAPKRNVDESFSSLPPARAMHSAKPQAECQLSITS